MTVWDLKTPWSPRFAESMKAAGVYALPQDSIAIHEALLAAGYESTVVELVGAHSTAVDEPRPEFPRLVEIVVSAVDSVR